MQVITAQIILAIVGLASAAGAGYSIGAGASISARWILPIVALAAMVWSAVLSYAALSAATSAVTHWRTRWGLDAGTAPKLLRMILLSLEPILGLKPCQGSTVQERAERVILELSASQTHPRMIN